MSDVQQLNDLGLLEEVSQLLTTLELPEVLRRIVEITSRLAGEARVSLIFQDNGRWLYYTRGHQLTNTQESSVAQELIERGFAGWLMRNNKGDIIADTETDARWYHFGGGFHEARSAMGMPLAYRDKVLGSIVAAHPEPNHFGVLHLRLMRVLAFQASVAVHNAQIFEQVQAQRRQFQAVLQAVPDVLLVVNASGKIIMASDAILSLLDGLTLEAVAGMPIQDLAAIDSVFTSIVPIVTGHMPEYGEWALEARSAKRKRDYLVNVSVWDTPHRREVGYVVVMKDITALRSLARIKDEVMGLVRHDLAQPLNLIKGYNALLKEDLQQNPDMLEQTEYASTISDAVERMEQLLEKLMLVEKVRGSPLEMVEKVALNGIARAALEDQMPFSMSKNIYLQDSIDTTHSPEMVGNEIMLKQSMGNLISNAIKYTPEGGSVKVSTSLNDSWYEFRVEDTGIGIAAHELGRVFDSFYRTENAGQMSYGSGIGLSLVRSIVEQHGGHVGVDSTVGKGSIFWFRLPVVRQ